MSEYFYDLHIHSCLSPCADDDMTPNNIAAMSAIKGLGIVALTDHNCAKNCPAFFEACKRQGIVPIAGMELSTAEDIHILCLFESLEDAMRFDEEVEKHVSSIKNRPEIFGNQLMLDAEDELIKEIEPLLISATDLSVDEAIALARDFGAHVHPAHVDRESNGILAILGDIPEEYEFDVLEFYNRERRDDILQQISSEGSKTLICSDAHHLWDINEAENSIELDDEPYSSALVRQRFFEWLKKPQ